MLIKEYRIPLPMTVEEYRIAQLYMIAKKSREETKVRTLLLAEGEKSCLIRPTKCQQISEKMYSLIIVSITFDL